MHIEFLTDDMREDDAKALAAMLMALFPTTDLFGSASRVTLAVGDASITGRLADVQRLTADEEGDASVAFKPDPDAAAAFTPLATPAPIAAPAPPSSASVTPASPASPAPPVSSPSPSPAGPVTLDKDGLPWDARIHAKAKTFKADGTWKSTKPAPDAATLANVIAELRATMGAPAGPPAAGVAPVAAPAPAAPPATPAPVVAPPPSDDAASIAAEYVAAGGVLPTPAAPAPASPPADPPAGTQTFVTLMRKVAKAQTDKLLTMEEVSACAAAVGLANMAAVAQRPDLIPAFDGMVDAYIASHMAA